MKQPSGMEMVVALLRYLGRAGIQLDRDEVAEKLIALLPEEGGILVQTMADAWIEEGKAIGHKEGKEEGRKEGQREGQRTMIMHILQRRFPANEMLAQEVAARLTQIDDETMLNQLADLALEVIVLPDFVRQLRELMPTSN